MKTERYKSTITLLKSVKQTSVCVSQTVPIHLHDRYIMHLTKVLYNCGKEEYTKLGKELYNIAVRTAMRRSYSPLRFRKSDNEGFPDILKGYKKHLLSDDPNEVRAVLTMLRSVYGSYLEPHPQVDSITAPGIKPEQLSWLGDFEKFVQNKWSKPFKVQLPTWTTKYLYESNKSGPSGPSLIQSIDDIHRLMKSKEVFLNLQSYLVCTNQEGLIKYMRYLWESTTGTMVTSSTLSKLAFLPEGGGKTRTIAMVDYWSQTALLTLHQALMKLLRKMSTDGTYNQTVIAEKVKQWTAEGKPQYSFDLTTATDRFPVFLQGIVLSRLIGNKQAYHWMLLLRDRTFSSAIGDVQYSIGQPMGMYSSWAAFAVTHHALVEYCAFKERIFPFRDYVILGDDVSIANDKVAARYRDILDQLKVPLSIAKSVVPEDQSPPAAEIAKRLFVSGKEISPLPPDLILQASRNMYMFPALIRESQFRGMKLELNRWAPLKRWYSWKEQQRLEFLLSLPPSLPGSLFKTQEDWDRTFPPSGEGSYSIFDGSIPLSRVIEAIKKERLSSLSKKLDRMMKFAFKNYLVLSRDDPEGTEYDFKTSESLMQKLSAAGVAIPDSPSAVDRSPLSYVIFHQAQTLFQLRDKIYEGEITGDLDEKEYVPDILTSQYFRTKKEVYRKRISSLYDKVMKDLVQQGFSTTKR